METLDLKNTITKTKYLPNEHNKLKTAEESVTLKLDSQKSPCPKVREKKH